MLTLFKPEAASVNRFPVRSLPAAMKEELDPKPVDGAEAAAASENKLPVSASPLVAVSSVVSAL